MASISLAYVDHESLANTTPIPSLEASVSIVNDSLKFGIAKMGVVIIACLSCRKVVSTSSLHLNCPLFKRLVSGFASIP